jgi:hypothetical protein
MPREYGALSAPNMLALTYFLCWKSLGLKRQSWTSSKWLINWVWNRQLRLDLGSLVVNRLVEIGPKAKDPTSRRLVSIAHRITTSRYGIIVSAVLA